MRRILFFLCPALMILLACSKDDPSGTPGGNIITPPVVSNSWILLLDAGYGKVPADTLELMTPQSVQCPDTGSTPVTVPADTQKTAYGIVGDTLRLEMTSEAMQGIVALMPGIDSATLDLFVQADAIIKNPLYAAFVNPIYAAFGARGTHDSLKGTWVFGRIDLGPMRTTLLAIGFNDMVDTVDAMSAELSGKLMLDVTALQIKASVKRDYYTEMFVTGIADTARYNLAVTKVNDSLWTVSDTAGDTVASITGLGNGDMVFTGTVAAWQPYTYRLNPVDCPDVEAPAWYTTFRDAHSK